VTDARLDRRLPALAVPVERYVDARELAALMAVSPTTIKRWVKEGMPSETWGMKRTRRFLPSHAIAWASARQATDTIPLTGPDRARNASGRRQAKE
jgi:hypothetical protein